MELWLLCIKPLIGAWDRGLLWQVVRKAISLADTEISLYIDI